MLQAKDQDLGISVANLGTFLTSQCTIDPVVIASKVVNAFLTHTRQANTSECEMIV